MLQLLKLKGEGNPSNEVAKDKRSCFTTRGVYSAKRITGSKYIEGASAIE